MRDPLGPGLTSLFGIHLEPPRQAMVDLLSMKEGKFRLIFACMALPGERVLVLALPRTVTTLIRPESRVGCGSPPGPHLTTATVRPERRRLDAEGGGDPLQTWREPRVLRRDTGATEVVALARSDGHTRTGTDGPRGGESVFHRCATQSMSRTAPGQEKDRGPQNGQRCDRRSPQTHPNTRNLPTGVLLSVPKPWSEAARVIRLPESLKAETHVTALFPADPDRKQPTCPPRA